MTSVEQKFSRSQGRFTWAGRPFQKAPARTPKNKDRFEPPPLPSTPGEFSLYTYPPQETTSDQMVQSLKAASQEMKQSTKQMGRVLKERVNEKVNEMTEDFGMGTEIEARRRLTTSVVRPRGSADKRMLRLSFMYQNQVGNNQWLDDDKLSQELKRDAGPRNIRELQRLKSECKRVGTSFSPSSLPYPSHLIFLLQLALTISQSSTMLSYHQLPRRRCMVQTLVQEDSRERPCHLLPSFKTLKSQSQTSTVRVGGPQTTKSLKHKKSPTLS